MGMVNDDPEVRAWPTARLRAMERAISSLGREYIRAVHKHGERTLDGNLATEVGRLAALVEEVGEVAQLMTYDKRDEDFDTHRRELYGELIQVANLALAWAGYLDASGKACPEEVREMYLPHDDDMMADVREVLLRFMRRFRATFPNFDGWS